MRHDDKATPLDRRAFFKNVARWSLAGGMAAAAIAAWRRRPIAEPACVNEGVCRGCPAFTDCGLPQALSAKKVLGSGQEKGTGTISLRPRMRLREMEPVPANGEART